MSMVGLLHMGMRNGNNEGCTVQQRLRQIKVILRVLF